MLMLMYIVAHKSTQLFEDAVCFIWSCLANMDACTVISNLNIIFETFSPLSMVRLPLSLPLSMIAKTFSFFSSRSSPGYFDKVTSEYDERLKNIHTARNNFEQRKNCTFNSAHWAGWRQIDDTQIFFLFLHVKLQAWVTIKLNDLMLRFNLLYLYSYSIKIYITFLFLH